MNVTVFNPEVTQLIAEKKRQGMEAYGALVMRENGSDSTLSVHYETPEQIRAHARELEALAVMLEENL